ncbi:hypothetical protein [Aquabacterium humicola]|uniref:hypothetical protein n=1 Tax=Aquabacterium humicola TaxID=3237377 RepID=UPI002543FA50|nr:hypothetical protein [Rubrivivax pictus]
MAHRPPHGLGPGSLLLAAGAGALFMALLDPQQGRRRRALLVDRWQHGQRLVMRFADAGWRDLSHRTHGLVADLRGRHGPAPDDPVLAERVRARLGRLISHPHTIAVQAHAGTVQLEGLALERERAKLLLGVQAVPGVQHVLDLVDWRAEIGREPALQGSHERSGPRPEFLQQHWAPGPRLLAAVVGGALAAWALGHPGVRSRLLGSAGAALAWRALSRGDGSTPARPASPVQGVRVEHGPLQRDDEPPAPDKRALH